MSVTSQLSGNPDKIFKKPLHRRNDSGELDVFEAAGYFSGYNEVLFSQKNFKEVSGRRSGGGRMSLDLPLTTNVIPLPQPEKPSASTKEKIKHRQPSSPGGRLASFLNSLFNQSSSKKKKLIKSKNPTPSLKNEDHEGVGGGRKRRSSLSSLIDSKSSSIYSSTPSGFRTPPAVNYTIQTPIKNYKEIRSLLDQKNHQVLKNNREVVLDKIYKKGFEDKKEIMIRKMEVVDEGAESDSSSDLFELRIYDVDSYSSSGLPVYETTNIQSIKRSSVL